MDLATYFWQVNVAWLLLYAVYWAFLCRDTFFRWNRFYLLAATVFAISFPFLPIPTLFQDAVPEDQVLLFFGGEQQEVAVTQAVKVEVQTLFTWENILLSTYLIGTLFLFMRLIINLLKIFKLAFPISSAIRRNTKIMSVKENYFIVQTPVGTPIFSFLNILFWNENAGISGEEKAKIIAHELVHIRQWHSLDVLFMELMTIVFWCNPIAWAYRKSLQAVHEYLADAKVLEKETSKTDYANLLVSQFLHTNTLYLSNHFFSKSLLKNRIMMMYQKKSNQKAFVKFAFVLPIVAICLLVAACNNKIVSELISKENATIYTHQSNGNQIITIDLDKMAQTVKNAAEDYEYVETLKQGEINIKDIENLQLNLIKDSRLIDRPLEISLARGKRLVCVSQRAENLSQINWERFTRSAKVGDRFIIELQSQMELFELPKKVAKKRMEAYIENWKKQAILAGYSEEKIAKEEQEIVRNFGDFSNTSIVFMIPIS